MGGAKIAGGSRPQMRLEEERYRKTLSESSQKFVQSDAAAVVGHDNLEPVSWVLKLRNSFQTVQEIFRPVPCGNDDRKVDAWRDHRRAGVNGSMSAAFRLIVPVRVSSPFLRKRSTAPAPSEGIGSHSRGCSASALSSNR